MILAAVLREPTLILVRNSRYSSHNYNRRRSYTMLGIGHHLEKHTKIKILAEKSKQYNARAQDLEAQNVDAEQIPEILTKEDYERRHHDDPAPNQRKVQGLGGSIGMGFNETHKIPSSTQAMFQPVETSFKKTQQLKSQGKPFANTEAVKQQKEINQKMKHRIYQDHLEQMWEGMDEADKMLSENKKNYVYNENYQKELNTMNKEHFQRKNDLKWYSEEYVKTKLSLRK